MLRNNLCESLNRMTFFTVMFSKYYEIKTLLVATNLQIWAQLSWYTLLNIFISSVFLGKNVFAFLQLMETKALGGRIRIIPCLLLTYNFISLFD